MQGKEDEGEIRKVAVPQEKKGYVPPPIPKQPPKPLDEGFNPSKLPSPPITETTPSKQNKKK